jgi:hypothetical protein
MSFVRSFVSCRVYIRTARSPLSLVDNQRSFLSTGIVLAGCKRMYDVYSVSVKANATVACFLLEIAGSPGPKVKMCPPVRWISRSRKQFSSLRSIIPKRRRRCCAFSSRPEIIRSSTCTVSDPKVFPQENAWIEGRWPEFEFERAEKVAGLPRGS